MNIPSIDLPINLFLAMILLFFAISAPFENLRQRGKLDTIIIAVLLLPLILKYFSYYTHQGNNLALLSMSFTATALMVQIYFGFFKPDAYLSYNQNRKIITNPRALNQLMIGMSIIASLPFFFL